MNTFTPVNRAILESVTETRTALDPDTFNQLVKSVLSTVKKGVLPTRLEKCDAGYICIQPVLDVLYDVKDQPSVEVIIALLKTIDHVTCGV